MEKNTAIVLAAGSGSRMKSNVKKQYMELKGKPVLYYSLQVFEQHQDISEIILVTSEEDIEYCRSEIAERYRFSKVTEIVSGGKERYHSVWAGLCAARTCDHVLIHDGARPFVTGVMIDRLLGCVRAEKACVAGMPVKDTIKIADEQGYVAETPLRSRVWQVQTPQVFDFELIRSAYERLIHEKIDGVTDDAMVLECMTGRRVRLIEGAYENIKITTPEDLTVAELYCRQEI